MKKLIFMLSFIVLSASLVSCANQGMKVVTREDGTSNLSNYDTYAWVEDIENIPSIYAFYGPEGTLLFNNNSKRKMIKDAVELQMKARGFTENANNPEMLVSFSVLEGETELRTFVLNNRQDYLGFGPRSESAKMVPVDKGTVLINFLDANSGTQLWQGFASGALQEEDLKDMGTLQTKVAAIFEDFEFDQFDFTSK